MKFSTGKTARAIRRREIYNSLLSIADELVSAALFNKQHPQDDPVTKPELVELQTKHTSLILELTEISAIDANQVTRPRKRQ